MASIDQGEVPGPSVSDLLMDVWQRAALDRTPLPGEPALAEALAAGRPAIREALARLEERGLVRRRRGAATLVNPVALDIPARFDEQMEQSDLIAAMGHRASLEVLNVEVIDLSDEDAEWFELPTGTRAVQTTKRWRADDIAVMAAIDTIPLAPGRRNLPNGFDFSTSVFTIAEQIGCGIAEWEIAWPSATNLDARTSRLLERTRRDAALSLELAGVGRQGSYLYRAIEYHAQDAFSYALIRSVRRP